MKKVKKLYICLTRKALDSCLGCVLYTWAHITIGMAFGIGFAWLFSKSDYFLDNVLVSMFAFLGIMLALTIVIAYALDKVSEEENQ